MKSFDQERLRILFVCTANVCRSPMAAALMSLEANEHDLPVDVASAGLLPGGQACDSRVVERAARVGGDVERHRSREVSQNLVCGADFILTMTADHVVQVAGRFPSAMARTHTLRHFVQSVSQRSDGQDLLEWAMDSNTSARQNYARATSDEDIADPINEPDVAFDALLMDLSSLVGWLRRQIQGSGSPDLKVDTATSTPDRFASRQIVATSDEHSQSFLAELHSAASSVKKPTKPTVAKPKIADPMVNSISSDSSTFRETTRNGATTGRSSGDERSGERLVKPGQASVPQAEDARRSPNETAFSDLAGSEASDDKDGNKFASSSDSLLHDTLFLVVTSHLHRAWEEASVECTFTDNEISDIQYRASSATKQWDVDPSPSARSDGRAALGELARRMQEANGTSWASAVFTVKPYGSWSIEHTLNADSGL